MCESARRFDAGRLAPSAVWATEVVPADRLKYCNTWQPVPFQFFVALIIRWFNFWGWSYPRKLNHLKNFHVYGITCAASSSITIIMWSAVVGCYIVWLPCFIAFKLTRSIILMHTSIRIVVYCMHVCAVACNIPLQKCCSGLAGAVCILTAADWVSSKPSSCMLLAII